jgi:hypothetical protein
MQCVININLTINVMPTAKSEKASWLSKLQTGTSLLNVVQVVAKVCGL